MNNIVVTGGGGFVGTAIVKRLLGTTDRITAASRNRYNHLERLGVRCLQGDLADPLFTDRICRGADTVFHVAAKAGIWGSWNDYYRTNVLGTENVVRSCLRNGVGTLVYTSTPSVVFRGRDIRGGDESLPYAKRHLCHYQHTKVLAERLVLSSNSEKLRTCAIRPHLVWGPGDPHLVPRLLDRGRKADLKIVGSGTNMVDITYVENVAQAHVLAAENLQGGGRAAGRAYFIGQERPVQLWQWINELLESSGIPVVTVRIPYLLAYAAGAVMEAGYRLAGRTEEPKMTRFLAGQLARSHFFSHDRAALDFGYQPIVTLETGMKRLLGWLEER